MARAAAAVLAFAMLLPQSQATATAATMLASGVPVHGVAKHYSTGTMERVARYRGLPALPRMASVPDCGRIGWWAIATVNGSTDFYLVVDCSAPKDRARHIRSGLVLEVNYASKLAYFPRGEGRAPATVWGFVKWPYGRRHIKL